MAINELGSGNASKNNYGPGETILSGDQKPVISIIGTAGMFYSSRINSQGEWQSARIYRAPTTLAVNSAILASESPYYIRSLGDTQITVNSQPDRLDTKLTRISREAELNDINLLSQHASVLKSRGLKDRVSGILLLLADENSLQTPPIGGDNIALLAGTSRTKTSTVISALAKSGELNRSGYRIYEITQQGLASTFGRIQRTIADSSGSADLEEMGLEPNLENLGALIEARQRRPMTERVAFGLWLITEGSSRPSRRITEQDFANLVAAERGKLLSALCQMEIEQMIHSEHYAKRSYSLTPKGEEFVKSL